MSKSALFSGIACMAGFLTLSGGCKSLVMAERGYIPVDEEASAQYEAFKSPETEVLPPAPVSESQTAAIDSKQPAAVKEYPSFESVAGKLPAGPARNFAGGEYTVKKGDIISRIAYAHGVSTQAVLAANNMTLKDAKRLRIGQKLVIPGKNAAKSVSSKRAAVKKSVRSSASQVVDGYYTVKSGDNIPKIARRLKVKASDLMAANNLDDAATRRLQIGQKLVVPGSAGKAHAAVIAGETVSEPATPAVSAQPAAGQDVSVDDVEAAMNSGAALPQPEAAVAAESVVGGSEPKEVKEDTRLEDFVKTYNITADEFKKFNVNAVTADGIIPAGSIVFIPVR